MRATMHGGAPSHSENQLELALLLISGAAFAQQLPQLPLAPTAIPQFVQDLPKLVIPTAEILTLKSIGEIT